MPPRKAKEKNKTTGAVKTSKRGKRSTEAVASPRTSARRDGAGMSEEHKAALAEGRQQGAAVRAYLGALDLQTPRRGRRRTKAAVEGEIEAVEGQVSSAVGVARLEALQRRRDLRAELARFDDGADDLETLKERFVASARDYAKRKGIDYQTFREFGVPAAVLKEAGITRAGR